LLQENLHDKVLILGWPVTIQSILSFGFLSAVDGKEEFIALPSTYKMVNS